MQVTLWQLSREKSLIAKRSEMKGNSGHTSKANFGSDICEFESSHPSQPVRSPLCDFRVCENRRHSRGLGWRARVSGWQILEFRLWTRWLCGASLRSPFSNFRFGMPETGSICDGDRFAESISRLHVTPAMARREVETPGPIAHKQLRPGPQISSASA